MVLDKKGNPLPKRISILRESDAKAKLFRDVSADEGLGNIASEADVVAKAQQLRELLPKQKPSAETAPAKFAGEKKATAVTVSKPTSTQVKSERPLSKTPGRKQETKVTESAEPRPIEAPPSVKVPKETSVAKPVKIGSKVEWHGMKGIVEAIERDAKGEFIRFRDKNGITHAVRTNDTRLNKVK